MEKIIVRGGRKLQGEVDISIAKNSVLPIIVATILNPTEIILKKVPMLEDVTVLINLLRELNCEVQFSSITGDLKINTLNLKEHMQVLRFQTLYYLNRILAFRTQYPHIFHLDQIGNKSHHLSVDAIF